MNRGAEFVGESEPVTVLDGHLDVGVVVEAVESVEPRRRPVGRDAVATAGQGRERQALLPRVRMSGDGEHAGRMLDQPSVADGGRDPCPGELRWRQPGVV